jgi:hypothetical protein
MLVAVLMTMLLVSGITESAALTTTVTDAAHDPRSGGWPYQAVEFMESNGGLAAEDSYPYHAVDQQCQKAQSVAGSTPSGRLMISEYSGAVIWRGGSMMMMIFILHDDDLRKTITSHK